MTVSQDFELRKTSSRRGRQLTASSRTTSPRRRPKERRQAIVLGDLKGMTSLAYTAKDPVALAKALTKYAKDNAAFTFKAGMVEGRVIDIKAINELAAMPPKEEIYAKLLYLINATATRLVTSINGVGRNLAVVLDQGSQGKQVPSSRFWVVDEAPYRRRSWLLGYLGVAEYPPRKNWNGLKE